MKFPTPLIKTHFIKRYKRFFVDGEACETIADINKGEILTAHCANTGSMKGLLVKGCDAYFSRSNNPKRKLKYSLEMLGTPTSLVGVNTSLPNALTADAIVSGKIPQLAGYDSLKREVKYGSEGRSRIDILLTDSKKPPCYVEVKNVTLRENVNGIAVAKFPDAVTTRGAKHLDELMAEVDKGNRAMMLYIVQRKDCDYFAPADEIDPVYGEKLRQAAKKGVELLAFCCKLSPEKIEIDKELKVKI